MKRSCTRCGDTYPLTADYFARSTSNRSGYESVCKRCRFGESLRPQDHQRHVQRRRNELRPPRQHICSVCCNLSWARPVTGCPSCGKPFAPEKPFTLTDAMQLPGGPGHVLPNSGGWE